MASSNLRKLTDPGTLRALRYDNLIALLGNFKEYFKTVVYFQIEGIPQEEFDFDRLSSILIDQLMVGDYAELFNAFALIGAMSADTRTDTLREYIDAQPYADEQTDNMCGADLALLVYLHNPKALIDIDNNFNATRKRSFAVRVTARNVQNVSFSEQQVAEFEQLMNMVFAEHHRGNTARVYAPTIDGDELNIVIRHGDSFRRQGVVDSGRTSKTLAFQPESFDLLVLNRSTGELRICIPAEPQWLENSYAQALSKVLFGDYDAFSTARNNNLDRIKELGRDILLCPADSEIKRLDLLSIKALFSDDMPLPITISNASGDTLADIDAAKFTLSALGRILELKFLVRIGKREKTIILKNNNRSGYEYDDFGANVDAWLRHVGIIRTYSRAAEVQNVAVTTEDSAIKLAV